MRGVAQQAALYWLCLLFWSMQPACLWAQGTAMGPIDWPQLPATEQAWRDLRLAPPKSAPIAADRPLRQSLNAHSWLEVAPGWWAVAPLACELVADELQQPQERGAFWSRVEFAGISRSSQSPVSLKNKGDLAWEQGELASALQYWYAALHRGEFEPTLVSGEQLAAWRARLVVGEVLSGNPDRAQALYRQFPESALELSGELAGKRGAWRELLPSVLAELQAELPSQEASFSIIRKRWSLPCELTAQRRMIGTAGRSRLLLSTPQEASWYSLDQGIPGEFIQQRAVHESDGAAAADQAGRDIRDATPAELPLVYLLPAGLQAVRPESEQTVLCWSRRAADLLGEPDWWFSGDPVAVGTEIVIPVRKSGRRQQLALVSVSAVTGELRWHSVIGPLNTAARSTGWRGDQLAIGQIPGDDVADPELKSVILWNVEGISVLACSAADGSPRWERMPILESSGFEHAGETFSSAVITSGPWCYGLFGDRRVGQFELRTGRLRWLQQLPSAAAVLVGVDDNRLIVAGQQVWGLELYTGEVVWETQASRLRPGKQVSVVRRAGQFLLADDHQLWLVRSRTGQPLKHWPLAALGLQMVDELLLEGVYLVVGQPGVTSCLEVDYRDSAE